MISANFGLSMATMAALVRALLAACNRQGRCRCPEAPAFGMLAPTTARERAPTAKKLEGHMNAKQFIRSALMATSAGLALSLATAPAEARVTKIVVEKKTSPAFDGASFG